MVHPEASETCTLTDAWIHSGTSHAEGKGINKRHRQIDSKRRLIVESSSIVPGITYD